MNDQQAPGHGDFSIGSTVWPGVSKLIEEMGELHQVLGKLIGTHGQTDHWDGSNLRDRMEQEMADVIAAISFVGELNGLDTSRIAGRAETKIATFKEWQEEQHA